MLLTAIESKKPGSCFSVIPESRLTLRLLQPIEKDNAAEDASCVIRHNLRYYFNVCSIKQDPPDGHPTALLQVAHGHSKYVGLGHKFELNREYKFHIAVDSENAAPLSVVLTVSLGGES